LNKKKYTGIAVPVELHARLKKIAIKEGAPLMYILKLMADRWDEKRKEK